MLGKHNGVLTRLKDYCPFMVKNHCAAHRVNLTVSDTFKKDNKSQKVTDTLISITNFYNEAKKLAAFKELCIKK